MTDLKTRTWDDHGNPAWEVIGPYGAVTYRLLGNHLYFDPAYAVSDAATNRVADEVRLVAATGTEEQVYELLIGYYNAFPGSAPSVPDDIAGWRALVGDALVSAQIHAKWWAWPDDTIGGWAVMPHNVPPSTGTPVVGSFLCEQTARHIADLHNESVLPHIGGTR